MSTPIGTRPSLDWPSYAGLRMTSGDFLQIDPDGFDYELVDGIMVPSDPPVEWIAGRPPRYHGLRMSSNEYVNLADDGYRYELVDGVLILSPSPKPSHQKVASRILAQLVNYLEQNPVGEVLPETDVAFARKSLYKPEIIFIRAENVRANWHSVRTAPDMVCEVSSPSSRRYDEETKFRDYERFGVQEYWLIDLERESMRFFRLERGKFVELQPEGGRFASQAGPGFVLDLERLRKAFRPV